MKSPASAITPKQGKTFRFRVLTPKPGYQPVTTMKVIANTNPLHKAASYA
jgi:hypothetical protein